MDPVSIAAMSIGSQSLLDLASIGGAIEFITQSWYLTVGAALLVIAVVLSVLSGLLDIAVWVAVVGGIGLTVVGAVHWFFPGLIPIVITPSPANPILVEYGSELFRSSLEISRVFGPLSPAW